MSAKHTPGPWKTGHFSSIVGVPIMAQPDKTKNTIIVAGTQGTSAEPGNRTAHRAESEANARLIAAAPELLAALKNLVPRFESCCRHAGNSDDVIALSTQIHRDALAKAESREP